MIDDLPSARPRQVSIAGFGIAPSCLGFGCASLGSRVGARRGLRALEAAYDAGVTWFDVAPAYGAGNAERLLGRFLVGRRDKVVVTTKVGLAPPAALRVQRLAYTLGRPAARIFPGLRRAFRRTSGTRNTRLPLSAALITQSIEESLERLGTDHVDVYALHDPAPEDVARDDLLLALEKVVARGQALKIAVAGSGAACIAATALGNAYGVLQTSTAALRDPTSAWSTTTQLLVTHSVFGIDGTRDRLLTRLAADPGLRRRLVERGYDPDPKRAVSHLLIDAAFAANPNGIVLASIFGSGHRDQNLSRADRLRPDALSLLRAALS